MVRVIMIVEMAGRPAKHLTESLEKHVGILRDIKDVDVDRIEVSKPRVIARENKESNTENKNIETPNKNDSDEFDMFTAFAECEFDIPSFSRLSETMFDFMPSSVEVIEPSKVEMDTAEATDLLNNISGRMHRYDEVAKIAGERLRQMDVQLKAMHTALIKRDAEIADLKNIKKKSVDRKNNEEC